MSRVETLGHWFERDGVEQYAELYVRVTDGTRETYFEPAYPGEIEPIRLDIGDADDVDLRKYQWLVDQILASEPIPEPEQREYEHEDYYQ